MADRGGTCVVRTVKVLCGDTYTLTGAIVVVNALAPSPHNELIWISELSLQI